ncbi:UMP kinase [Paenibacillus glycinis]|uniref:Uridylate kinase n=1 Tax=Paenibacillus glycinis TaxID=2697035 RepID=A0ABW9XS95_9BACL|nr:UMP kinase [Paenibacillus glycinis]NBD25535.1 UMP kinase [Paenibacillus glycinis]
MLKYKRVLVKLSGGAMGGERGNGFDNVRLLHIVDEIISIVELGIEVSIILGGGNIFRGYNAATWGIDRIEADNLGTLATVMNSLMLRGVIKSKTNREVRVMSAIPISKLAEDYIQLRAIHHLEKGYIVIFAGGNGQPYVTTDYPSVQRALEVNSDAILVAKNGVDGVYDKDPKLVTTVRKFVSINHNEVISKNLKVIDQAAIILARDHNIPIHVFNFEHSGVMKAICEGHSHGTFIHRDVITKYEGI